MDSATTFVAAAGRPAQSKDKGDGRVLPSPDGQPKTETGHFICCKNRTILFACNIDSRMTS